MDVRGNMSEGKSKNLIKSNLILDAEA